MEATIQSLTVKLRAINDELQVFQDELINVSISMCEQLTFIFLFDIFGNSY